jgi:Peptidase family M48
MEAIRFSFDSTSAWGLQGSAVQLDFASDQPRRELLARSLRVEQNLFPNVAQSLTKVCVRLGLPSYPEAFVANDGTANAYCLPWPSRGGCEFAVILSSGLITLLDPGELEFVIGHEIGHYLFEHFRYPKVGPDDGVGERLALMNLSRSAEISADRFGLVATGSVEAGCGAMIKTACGLSTPHLRLHIPSILAQFRELTQDGGGLESSAFDSHPLLAVRLRAMLRFVGFQASYPGNDGHRENYQADLAKMDEAIRNDFDKASGFVAKQWEDQALEDVRLWAVIVLFVQDHKLTKREQELLSESFGVEKSALAIGFVKEAGGRAPEIAFERLRRACSESDGASLAGKTALFRDLELLALAASGETGELFEVLVSIARVLGIPDGPEKHFFNLRP